VYRIQKKNGNGPFKHNSPTVIQNRNQKFIEHDEILMEKLKSRFNFFEYKWDNLPKEWVFGCTSVDDLMEWFGESIWMLSRQGFLIYKGEVDEDNYYVTENQVIFNKKKARLKVDLNEGDDMDDVKWTYEQNGYLIEQVVLETA
jgi:hypothetical protein